MNGLHIAYNVEGRKEVWRRHDVPREVWYVAFCDLTDVFCVIETTAFAS